MAFSTLTTRPRVILRIAGGMSVPMLFESAHLASCRSVTIAACSSGLSRAEIASEAVGLTGVFLSAGARNVVGAMWEVNELATAILLDRYFSALDVTTPARALCRAQRELRKMRVSEVGAWCERYIAGTVRPATLARLGEMPFAAPVHWAAFAATGQF